MKKSITLLLLLCSAIALKAQTSTANKLGQSFVTKVSVVVCPFDDKNQTIVNSIHYLLNDDTKFIVYDVLDNGYVVSVWDYTDSTKRSFYNGILHKQPFADTIERNHSYFRMTKRQVGMPVDDISKDKKLLASDTNAYYIRFRNLAYVDSWGNNMKFFISLKDFNDKCESIYPKLTSFTWGFLTLPIKARIFKSFLFEEKVNFGVSFGCKWQRPTTVYSAHNLLFGVSISNVKIDSASVAKNYSSSLSATSAFTFSGGYMYQYDKFQIGAFIGMDYISNNSNIGWKYQGIPWIGVGLGLSLFSENQTKAQGTQSQADKN